MAKKKTPGRSPGGKDGFSSKGAARGRRGNDAPGRPARSKSSNSAKSANSAKPSGPVSQNRSRGFGGGARPYDYSLYENEPATKEYMARLFRQHDFAVGDRELECFWKYYLLLREHNASLDLTRIMGIEATVLKHFVDSAVILRWFEPVGPVLDIGSGPGFPGVPLAVMRPGIRFILAESRGKRVGFLEEVVSTLKLSNVEIFPKSVREDSPLGAEQGRPVGDVVTRALETMAPTLERVLPFLEPGRKVAFLKGPACDEEIAEALASFAGAYTLAADARYDLPGSDQPRRLVVFERAEIL